MSRVVVGPDEEEDRVRETDANDARGIRLSLTAAGKNSLSKADRRRRRAQQRLPRLPEREGARVPRAGMTKLAHEARGFIQKEKQAR